MKDESIPDSSILADIFYINVPKKKANPKTDYVFNGRKAFIEKATYNEYHGYFLDTHSITFIADTKRELIADMAMENGK